MLAVDVVQGTELVALQVLDSLISLLIKFLNNNLPNVLKRTSLNMWLIPSYPRFTVLPPKGIKIVTLARGYHLPYPESVGVSGAFLE